MSSVYEGSGVYVRGAALLPRCWGGRVQWPGVREGGLEREKVQLGSDGCIIYIWQEWENLGRGFSF